MFRPRGMAECRAMRNGIAAAVFGVVLAVFASAGRAVQEELLEQARKLVAEAKPYIETANNVDIEMEQRRGPRKEAFTRLKAARDAYDKYLDANPSMEEKLDKEYCDVAALLYWIKKDSGLGELEKDSPQPVLPGEDRA